MIGIESMSHSSVASKFKGDSRINPLSKESANASLSSKIKSLTIEIPPNPYSIICVDPLRSQRQSPLPDGLLVRSVSMPSSNSEMKESESPNPKKRKIQKTLQFPHFSIEQLKHSEAPQKCALRRSFPIEDIQGFLKDAKSKAS